MSTKGGPVFTFSLPGGATFPRQLRHCLWRCVHLMMKRREWEKRVWSAKLGQGKAGA